MSTHSVLPLAAPGHDRREDDNLLAAGRWLLDTAEIRLWTDDLAQYVSRTPDDVARTTKAPAALGPYFIHAARPLSGLRVVVLGGGAVGAWTAAFLHGAGAAVIVVDDGLNPTFYAAAGWVFPYHSTDARAISWSFDAARMWGEVAALLPTGAVTSEPTKVQRSVAADHFPIAFTQLPGFAISPPQTLDEGMAEGFTTRSFMAPAQLWHPVLKKLITDTFQVPWLHAHVGSVDQLDQLRRGLAADVVVDSTGISSAQLFRDEQYTPMRGTVLYLGLPPRHHAARRLLGAGIRSWDCNDGTHFDPYVIPQRYLRRVVVGGEMTPLSQTDAATFIAARCPVDPTVARRIMARATLLEPSLADLPILGARAGIRPVRPEMRVGRSPDHPWLIHAGGLGGAGITLAPIVARRLVNNLVDAMGSVSTGA